MTDPDLTWHATEGRYDGQPPGDLLSHMADHIEDAGIPVLRGDSSLIVTYDNASLRLDVQPDGLTAALRSETEAQLHQTREALLYLLDHVAPDVAPAMAWTGQIAEDQTPPNFHLARVIGTTRMSDNFVRMEMETDGLEALSVGGMHFTLLIPRDPIPEWPRLDARGRTRWPEDAGALHRAAYTFVTISPETGRFTFDIFEHEGGTTTTWAREVAPGTEVAVLGPGGGNFPEAEHLIMGGDETALPAIRRILQNAPADLCGHAFVETADPADRIAFDKPAGVALTWLDRPLDDAAGDTLWDALTQPDILRADSFVWLAAEQEIVRRARAHFRSVGVPRTQGYFSAYWTR